MSWQDELQSKTGEFLKEFSLAFLKCYGISLFLKIKNEIANDKTETRKLLYTTATPAAAVTEKNSLYKGWVYVRRGDGICSFQAWKKVYLQERTDHKLDVFKTDKDPKPMYSIPLVGYKLETDVTQYYKKQSRTLADDLEMEAPPVGFSRYTWALTHNVKDNFIFQMHKGKEAGGCACMGNNTVEPEDAGEEFAKEREEWIRRFESGLKDSCPRDIKNNVTGVTFERVIKKMKTEIPELKTFDDDGSEGEILGHMVYVAVLEASCKSDILDSVKNVPPMMRMQAWYKTRGIAFAILNKAVSAAWSVIQKQVGELTAKIEPKVRSGIQPILQKKGEIQKAIGDKISQHLGPALSTYVSPFLQPLFSVLDSPLREGLRAIEVLFRERASKIIPAGKPLTPEATEELMLLSKDVEVGKMFAKFVDKLVSPLQEMKSKNEEIFQDLKIEIIRTSAEALLRETLNACTYTLINKMKPPPPKEGETAIAPLDSNQGLTFVLECLQHDITIQLSNWCQITISSTLVGAFRRNVDPHVNPVITDLQNLIPEDFREILEIQNEYEEFINIFLVEPIKKVIELTYPAALPPPPPAKIIKSEESVQPEE